MMFNLTDIETACRNFGMQDDGIMKFLSCLPKRRSKQQNKALHLFCKKIADELNEQGQTFKTIKVLDGQELEHHFSLSIVKEYIWKPIQLALFLILKALRS